MYCAYQDIYPFQYGLEYASSSSSSDIDENLYIDDSVVGDESGDRLCADAEDTLPSNTICTDIDTDPIVALAGCEFIASKCSQGNTNSITKELGDPASIITINDMDGFTACTYKIKATTGAPGFNFDFSDFTHFRYHEFLPSYTDGSRPVVEGDAPVVEGDGTPFFEHWLSDAVLATWIEYELETTTTFQNTEYPDIIVQSYFTECLYSCAQGDLVKRNTGEASNLSYHDSNEMLRQLNNKRKEFAEYEKKAKFLTKFNAGMPQSLGDLGETLLGIEKE